MDWISSLVQSALGVLDGLHTSLYAAASGRISQAAADLRAAPLALGLAFALGMVHALTPGHGKSVVFSYLLGSDARLRTGIAMAIRIASLHVVSAVVLVLVIGGVVVRFGRLQGAARYLELVSYGAVTAVGLWLLWRAVFRAGAGLRGAGDIHGMRRGALGFAVGLLPCPLTLVLMNYALVNETVLGGVVLVGMMACGIAATMALVGSLGILIRHLLVGGVQPSSRRYRPAIQSLEVAASGVVVAIGVRSLATSLM